MHDNGLETLKFAFDRTEEAVSCLNHQCSTSQKSFRTSQSSVRDNNFATATLGFGIG